MKCELRLGRHVCFGLRYTIDTWVEWSWHLNWLLLIPGLADIMCACCIFLQGDSLHWLACALYVACRRRMPTVGHGETEGNCVSLTRMLRSAKLRWISSSVTIYHYVHMSELCSDCCHKVLRLELRSNPNAQFVITVALPAYSGVKIIRVHFMISWSFENRTVWGSRPK